MGIHLSWEVVVVSRPENSGSTEAQVLDAGRAFRRQKLNRSKWKPLSTGGVASCITS
jgi:hypothetical protein